MSRIDRIRTLLMKEISQILLKEINDSRIGFISITTIDISKDLGHAWIYYSEIGDDAQKFKTKKGLQAASSYIQGLLGKKLHLDTIPKLHFKFDDSIEKGSKVLKLIDELNT